MASTYIKWPSSQLPTYTNAAALPSGVPDGSQAITLSPYAYWLYEATVWTQITGVSSGDVVGPASATDTAIAKFSGTTGKLIQNSGVLINASNQLIGVAGAVGTPSFTFSGDLTTGLYNSGAGKIGLTSVGVGFLDISYTSPNTLIQGLRNAASEKILIRGADSITTGIAGTAVQMIGGAGTVGNAVGGSAQLTGGAGFGTSAGGLIQILGGAGSAASSGNGGAITVGAGGVAGSGTGNGGSANFFSGASTNGAGGTLFIGSGGATAGTGSGGASTFSSGNSLGGTGGALSIASGNSTNANAGTLTISGGTANTAAMQAGNLLLRAGLSSAGLPGTISFQTGTTVHTTKASISAAGLFNLANLSASFAVVSDASKNLISSVTTLAELAFLSGVTSNVQTQLNAKAAAQKVVVRASGAVTVVGTSATNIVFPTEAEDTNAAYDNTTGIFTCPVGQGGIYAVVSRIKAASSTTGLVGAYIFNGVTVNGSYVETLGEYRVQAAAVSQYPSVDGATYVRLAAGDTLVIQSARDTNLTAFTCSGSSTDDYLRIVGPLSS